jgi:hypothetical protein
LLPSCFDVIAAEDHILLILTVFFREQVMKVAILSGLLLGLGGNAAAMAAPLNFDCAAPIGRDSTIWRMRPEAPPFHVRGRIQPRWLYPLPANPQQMDGYSVIIADSRGVHVTIIDHDADNAIVFGVGSEGDALHAVVTMGRDGREDSQLIESFAWRHGDQLSIAFELSILAGGRATLRVGTREIPLDIALGANSQIMVSCSGGEFGFRDLEIDN